MKGYVIVTSFLAGSLLGWLTHEITHETRPTIQDSIAANWATLAVTLTSRENKSKTPEEVQSSAFAALLAMTPELGVGYTHISNGTIKSELPVLAKALLADDQAFAGEGTFVDSLIGRSVLLCIAQADTKSTKDVAECSLSVASPNRVLKNPI